MLKLAAEPIEMLSNFPFILCASDYSILKEVYDYQKSVKKSSLYSKELLEKILNTQIRKT